MPPSAETPFRLLLLGDFTGRPTNPNDPLRPVLVDRDNFDSVLAHLAPELTLPAAGQSDHTGTIRFEELDHFHPDHLYSRSPLFQQLRELREELSDPGRFADTTAELRRVTRPRPDAAELVGSGGLLDQILDVSAGAAPVRKRDAMQDFLERVLSEHLEPRKTPEQEKMLAKLDEAIAEQLRLMLHQSRYQSLEAAWRSVYMLTRRLDTDRGLKLYLLPLSQADLEADLTSSNDLRSSRLFDLLVRKATGSPGATPWAAVIGHYTFDDRVEHIDLLTRIALLSAQAGAPFFAATTPNVLGARSLDELSEPEDWHELSDPANWKFLRELPESRYLCLSLPRFLLRLPYGEDTETTETFPLEEMPGAPQHEAYLWGNSAFACACALGQAYEEEGWNLIPGRHRDLDRMPLHVSKVDGESVSTPVAEVLLPEDAIRAIYGRGITPLVSMRDGDVVRILRLQSVAGSMIAGRWD